MAYDLAGGSHYHVRTCYLTWGWLGTQLLKCGQCGWLYSNTTAVTHVAPWVD